MKLVEDYNSELMCHIKGDCLIDEMATELCCDKCPFAEITTKLAMYEAAGEDPEEVKNVLDSVRDLYEVCRTSPHGFKKEGEK